MESFSISENESIVSVLIKDNCRWEDFYRTAELIEKKLILKFHNKIDDFDSKYWDFYYFNVEYVLHYHQLTEELDIFTDKKNSKESLLQLVNELFYLLKD